ncbi:hypothetical protein G9A89_012327 [Geosiphon pyriformis]|nr:hypothetical protein G9A89_012327 [Geosiphon pyriformis]
MSILVTGASGLLGRAVYKTLSRHNLDVIGIAKTRVKGDLKQLDLTDTSAVESFIKETNPKVIVHCAAERRPDVAEKRKDETLKLNVQVPEYLATISEKLNILLIYISTDYVFDGKTPPYDVDAEANPLNFYGNSKYQGEIAIRNSNSKAVILRVPVLYGDVEDPAESAVNILLYVVKDRNKKVSMDNYAIRYPSNVDDVARVIKDISVRHLQENFSVSGTYHFSAQEPFTKYKMCSVLADILGIPFDHITPEVKKPVDTDATRPYDCHLSNKSLEAIGIITNYVPFRSWWERKLIRKK